MYKIFKKEYYDEYGKLARSWFIIKRKKTFLWRAYWKPLTRSGYGGRYTMTFSSYPEAKEFVREILCKDKPREKYLETQINECSCK
jgi:hypothetical protein